MEVTPAGIVTCDKEEPEKALAGMFVTLSGIRYAPVIARGT